MGLERTTTLQARMNASGEVTALYDPRPLILRRWDPRNLNTMIAAAKKCAGCPLETDCQPVYQSVRRGLAQALSLTVKGARIGDPDCFLTTQPLSVQSLGSRDQENRIANLNLQVLGTPRY